MWHLKRLFTRAKEKRDEYATDDHRGSEQSRMLDIDIGEPTLRWTNPKTGF